MNRVTSLDLYEAVITYDSENNPIKTWARVHAVTDAGVLVTDGGVPVSEAVGGIVGNLMPKALTESQIKQYGISTRAANTKVFYFNPDPLVAIGTRLYDGATWYDVRAVSPWPKHYEAILEPV